MPGRVISVQAPSTGAIWSEVEFGDRILRVNLVMLPDTEIGDHVLVHSGYAIRKVSAQTAADVPLHPSLATKLHPKVAEARPHLPPRGL